MADYNDANYYLNTTIGSDGQLNAAPVGIQHMSTGAGLSEVLIDTQGRYSIDIFSDMKTWKAENTPLLSLVSNMGSESWKAPEYTWMDEYTGDSWVDAGLDQLRLQSVFQPSGTSSVGGYTISGVTSAAHTINNTDLPYDITSASQLGGQLNWIPAAMPTADSDGVLTSTAKIATVNSNKAVFGFKIPSGKYIQGSLSVVSRLIHNLLSNYTYTADTSTYGDSNTYIMQTYSSSTSKAPIYVAFENLTYSTDWANDDAGCTEVEDHEVIALLNRFCFADDYSELYIEVDFATSNLDVTWDTTSTSKSVSDLDIASGVATATATAHGFSIGDKVTITGATGDNDDAINTSHYVTSVANANTFTFVIVGSSDVSEENVSGTILAGVVQTNKVLLEEVAYGGDEFSEGSTRISRMLMIGKPLAAPLGVPEGDRLGAQGGYIYHVETHMNYVQLFTCPKYGITGTTLASAFRFGSGFETTRARAMQYYKDQQEAAFMYGVKSQTYVASSDDAFVDGKPVRTTSGLLDYAMFPIKYFKTTRPASYTVGDSGITFKNWLDNLIYKTKAFRQKSANSITYLCPQDFMSYISNQIAFIGSHTTGNISAGMWMKNAPEPINYYLESWTYNSPYGTVNFVHEPAFDTMPQIAVPEFIYGENVNPRKLLLAVDTANMKKVTLRPDKILGNIQENDRDAVMEGIRGEHGFKLRYPKNFTMIYYG